MSVKFHKLPHETCNFSNKNPHFLNAFNRFIYNLGTMEDAKQGNDDKEFWIELAKFVVKSLSPRMR